MGLEVELLRTSFELVRARTPELTSRLYAELFRRRPEARPLFTRQARDKQEEMLEAALVAVVEHLDDASWMRERLHALGARHAEYGVTPEMYGWFGDALLATLADAAGDAWTPRVRAAWLDAYTSVAMLMIDGQSPATIRPTST
jgi:hemoglobin-like flavoprotein